jgi:hypothetical protein
MKILFLLLAAVIVGLAFMPTPTTAVLTANAATQSGFVSLYDKNCTDKTAYGQVIDVTQYYNNVGAVTDNLTTINGQSSYTSGYIDIRGYSYFTTNNDPNFEIICYNENKEQIAWIAENDTASNFRINQSTIVVTPLSLSLPTVTRQKTINNKTLVMIKPDQQFGNTDTGGGTSPIHTASVSNTNNIAYVRVAFSNTESNPYFNAFTDDFEMLIKLNRDDTSGGVLNALMVDIHDGVFTGFTLTALDLTFEVGTIIKNTSNEIIFSVPAVELWFYYTATNGGWQSILTGVQYFSYYANETITLNTPTHIAPAPYTQNLASIEDGGNNLIGDNTTNTTNSTITNIFNDTAFTYPLAIVGGILVLAIIGSLIRRQR